MTRTVDLQEFEIMPNKAQEVSVICLHCHFLVKSAKIFNLTPFLKVFKSSPTDFACCFLRMLLLT